MTTPKPHPAQTHLDTDSVERDIRAHTARAGLVTVAAQGAKFAITTATIGVLGRLLTPRDFGLVTMVMVVTNLLARFRTLGLESSTIQRDTISHAQVSALFWINTAFGLVLTAIVAAGAPLVATLYGEPSLTAITLAISSIFLIGALGAQHTAVLRRSMRFGRLAVAEVVSVTLAGAVAIGFALSGAGYWSLVAMHLTIALALTLGLWIASPWRPSLPARAPELASMLRFGAGVAGSDLLQTVIRQVDKVLIGVHLSASTLGFYSRGYNLLLIPLHQITTPLSGVAISSLSRVQRDAVRFRTVYKRGTLVTLSLTLPPCVFALLFAEQCVIGVLGDQWHDAIPIFLALVPAAVAWAFEPTVRWVYVSLGRSDREFAWRLMSAVVSVAAFVYALRFGAIGVAWAFSICAIGFRLPELAYCFRGTPIRLRDLAGSAWRPAASSLIAGALTAAALRFAIPQTISPLAQLSMLLPIFIASTAFAWVALPGGRAVLAEARTLARDLRA